MEDFARISGALPSLEAVPSEGTSSTAGPDINGTAAGGMNETASAAAGEAAGASTSGAIGATTSAPTSKASIEVLLAAVRGPAGCTSGQGINETTSVDNKPATENITGANESLPESKNIAVANEAARSETAPSDVETRLPRPLALPDFNIHKAPATTRADPSKPSFADLPYNIQATIFQLASDKPRVFFVNVNYPGKMSFHTHYEGLISACHMSREMFLRNRRLYTVGTKWQWFGSEVDIFYIRNYDPHVPLRLQLDWRRMLESGQDVFEWALVHHVAVDLEYLHRYQPTFPRPCGDMRNHALDLWGIFHDLRSIRVFVPAGRPWLEPLDVTPEALVLGKLHLNHIVAAANGKRETWGGCRYHFRKTCYMLQLEGFSPAMRDDNVGMVVCGHLVSMRDTQVAVDAKSPEEGSPKGSGSNVMETDGEEKVEVDGGVASGSSDAEAV